MAIDYVALRAELDAGHPDTLAYSIDDATAVTELNVVNRTRVKSSMTGADIFVSTDSVEYSALTDAQKSQWLAFCAIQTHNPEVGGLAQLFVVDIFGGGSTTVINLSTERIEDISRAEELFGINVIIGDVQNARAL